jgi:protoheme IX farnesyltransferase
MLPVLDPTGKKTGRQAVLWGAALIPVSLTPSMLGLVGTTYFVGALALGLAFLGSCLAFARTVTSQTARRVLRVSIIYLPVILIIMLIDRIVS